MKYCVTYTRNGVKERTRLKSLPQAEEDLRHYKSLYSDAKLVSESEIERPVKKDVKTINPMMQDVGKTYYYKVRPTTIMEFLK